MTYSFDDVNFLNIIQAKAVQEVCESYPDSFTNETDVSYIVHTIVDDGCYACLTNSVPMAMNEAGDIECMAGLTVIQIFSQGEFITWQPFHWFLPTV